MAGSEFKLTCKFSGSPQPEVEWFKDGGPLEENDRVTCTVNDDVTSLVIKKTEADDEGWYRCRISNEKSATAIEAELIVVETPTFVTELEDVTIDEGMKWRENFGGKKMAGKFWRDCSIRTYCQSFYQVCQNVLSRNYSLNRSYFQYD